MAAIEVHVVQCSPLSNLELARALLGFQHAAYAVEAELIGDDRIPGLHESAEELQAADLLWLACRLILQLLPAR